MTEVNHGETLFALYEPRREQGSSFVFVVYDEEADAVEMHAKLISSYLADVNTGLYVVRFDELTKEQSKALLIENNIELFSAIVDSDFEGYKTTYTTKYESELGDWLPEAFTVQGVPSEG